MCTKVCTLTLSVPYHFRPSTERSGLKPGTGLSMVTEGVFWGVGKDMYTILSYCGLRFLPPEPAIHGWAVFCVQSLDDFITIM